MNKKTGGNTLCKIVYFDEDSVTDYIQIVAGGKLEKTTELLTETGKNADAKMSTKAGGGIGGIFKALIGFEASASVEGELGASFNTNRMAKNIVKNTVLTDFINILDDENNNSDKTGKKTTVIRKFKGYKITAPKDSFSYIALISPYLSMIKSGTGISAGEFDVAVDKLDSTIKSAKGYYEFVGSNNDETVIFRFNINSFKNNYKATDLLKMDISIYAIKVGTSSIEKLNIDNELDIGTTSIVDNPSYSKVIDEPMDSDLMAELNVYDVLLSGVESID